MESDRFATAVRLIDTANAEDPHFLVIRGQKQQKELAQAALMTEWVQRLCPDASDALLLAARAHHVQRWMWPRSDYPSGRSGYLQWRRNLYTRHGEIAAAYAEQAGYETEVGQRIREIIGKKRLKTDSEVQTYEDALCLVFIETQFSALREQEGHEKMVEIVKKTLKKMSEEGQRLALEIPLEEADLAVVRDALQASA